MASNNDGTKVEEVNYEEALYMYETPETGLFASMVILEGLEFASVNSLKQEVNEQYSYIYFEEDHEEDVYNENLMLKELIVKNRDGLVVCKEGVFGWEEEEETYRLMGQLSTDKTKRERYVEIAEDMVFLQDGELNIIRSGHYSILNTETLSGSLGLDIITIKLWQTGQVKKITNAFGMYRVYEQDFASINYIEA